MRATGEHAVHQDDQDDHVPEIAPEISRVAGRMAGKRIRTKKGLDQIGLTPWLFWWAM
jgi:hypothetical protein